jgi:hypothetical protein
MAEENLIPFLDHCSVFSGLTRERPNVVIQRMPHPVAGVITSNLDMVKVKVKLELATKAQRRSRTMALLFL